MSATHDHSSDSGNKLRTAFFLSFAILGIEMAGGLISHSLALLSDAGHVLTDLVALGLAWFATVQSQRPADARKTYGYHRIGILAALFNALTLILIVGVIAVEAIGRLREPPTVTPTLMFVSAAVGIVVNLYIGLGLRGNVNVRAAMLHVFGDIVASIGVVVARVVILLTHWYEADAVTSLAIAVLIAKGAWNLMFETVDILMESTPKDLNVAQLVRDVVRIPGVSNVHDLHVWSIAGGVNALSAHLQIDGDLPLSECDALLEQMNRILADRHRITHTTIQFECANCDPSRSDLYCTLAGDTAVTTSHAHEP